MPCCATDGGQCPEGRDARSERLELSAPGRASHRRELSSCPPPPSPLDTFCRVPGTPLHQPLHQPLALQLGSTLPLETPWRLSGGSEAPRPPSARGLALSRRSLAAVLQAPPPGPAMVHERPPAAHS